MKASAALLKVFLAMFIFGTIGLFVKYIPLPSSVIALARGVIGTLFLFVVMLARKNRFSWPAVRKNLLWLCLSGAFLGFNWILLFEAYKHTTVATATLCYYMAPILVILVSPLLLKEKLTAKKLCCVLAALGGMVCISGVLRGGVPSAAELQGILLGLAAALLYAAIVLLNKKISGISAFERTILQLGLSAIVLLPYCLATVPLSGLAPDLPAGLLLVLVGIVHTGLAYFLYFGALDTVPAQTAAIVSYVDPVVAVLASVLLLQEAMTAESILGAVLILGAALVSEVSFKRRKKGQ